MAGFDVFVSYARADNEQGWVTAIRDLLIEDARSHSDRVPNVFLDTSEIHGMQDWKARILGALQSSKVLLICLSPAYLASEYCRWEREEFAAGEVRMRAAIGASDEDDGLMAQVFFVDLPETDPELSQAWRERFERTHGVDLRPWFTEGPETLRRAEVAERLRSLGADVFHRLDRAARADAAPGNLRRINPYFVGRTQELSRLRETVSRPGTVGVVTAVHGLGGLGKTELAVHYAHAFRDAYAGGTWVLLADGHSELVPLIGSLALEPRFGFPGSEAARRDPELLGREVIGELERRMNAGGQILLVLDNVSDQSLLSAPQLGRLPSRHELHVVATTRLGESDFVARAEVGFLALGGLDEDEGMRLIRDILVAGEPGVSAFAGPDEEAAARELVRLLAGFTLGIEQVALFLRARREIAPSMMLDMLSRDGLGGLEAEATRGDWSDVRHQQRLASVVFDTTLQQLSGPGAGGEGDAPYGARPGSADRVGRAARAALEAASMLPPDSVPWAWLEAIVGHLVPEAVEPRPFAPQGDWPQARRILMTRQLITPGDRPELARIHRLLADHVRPGPGSEVASLVRAQLLDRGRHGNSLGGLPSWEWRPLLEALVLTVHSLQDEDRVGFLDEVVGDCPDALIEAASNGARLEALSLVTLGGQVLRPSDDGLPTRTMFALHQVLGRLWEEVDRSQALTAYAESLDITRRLAAALPDNLQTQRDLTVSLNSIGRLWRDVDRGQALTAYQESLDITRRLAAALPDNLQTQRDLTVSLNNIGNLWEDVDRGKALTAYQEQLDITRRLAAALPDNLQTQRDLSLSLNSIGNLWEDVDRGQALTAYQEQLDITRRLAAALPDNLQTQRDLTVSLNSIGRLWEDVDRGKALTAYQEQLDITRRLAAALPDNLETQRDLTVSLNSIGRLWRDVDRGQALTAYAESLDITRRLAAALPDNLQTQRDLTVSLNSIGNLWRDVDRGKALTAYQEQLDITRRLAAALPDNLQTQRDLTVSLNSIGRLWRDVDRGKALTAYQESLDITRRLAAALPDNLQTQRDLSLSLDNIGRLWEDVDRGQALTAYQESLDIRRRLAAALPDNLETQRDLTVSLDNIGRLWEDVDRGKALTAYQEQLDITRRLAAALPDNLETQRDLTVSLDNIGRLWEDVDRGQALTAYQESLDIRRRLAAALPDNLETQRDLTVSLDNIGRLWRDVDRGKALTAYQEQLDITRRLAAALPDNLQTQRDLTVSLDNIGRLWRDVDRGKALTAYQEQLDITRRLAAALPDNLQTQRDLTVSLNNIGNLWRDVDRGKALTAYQESLDIRRRLAAALPGVTPRWDLCVGLANVAAFSDDPIRAELLTEAAEIAERLHRQFPDHNGLRGLASAVLRALADALERDEPQRAAGLRERAAEIAGGD